MGTQDAETIQGKISPGVSASGGATQLQLQPSGFLIELSLDWIVQRASENIHQLIGESHVTLIDEPLSRFVQAQALHDLRNHFSRLSGSTGVAKAYRVRLTDDRARCDVAFQLVGSRVLLEAVPSPEYGLGESLGAVGGLIDGLAALSGDALLDGAARRMRALTGCDGCIIQIGEKRATSSRGKFSLSEKIPAAGLPAFIADTEAATVPIFPRKSKDGSIASAMLKAPSAADAQALREQAVRSLISVPLISRGQPPGVVHCGYRMPQKPNFELHGASELFGQMFALRLEIDKLS